MNERNVGEVDLHNLQVSDPLIGQCQQLVREVAIPYQWEVLNDRNPEVIPSHAVENFRLAAGRASGEFHVPRYEGQVTRPLCMSCGPLRAFTPRCGGLASGALAGIKSARAATPNRH